MSITFSVSDVEPTTKPFRTCSAEEALRLLVSPPEMLSEKPRVKRPPRVPCEAHASPDRPFVAAGVHPFVTSALHAFRAHRPLSLSPDHLWVLLVRVLSLGQLTDSTRNLAPDVGKELQ